MDKGDLSPAGKEDVPAKLDKTEHKLNLAYLINMT